MISHDPQKLQPVVTTQYMLYLAVDGSALFCIRCFLLSPCFAPYTHQILIFILNLHSLVLFFIFMIPLLQILMHRTLSLWILFWHLLCPLLRNYLKTHLLFSGISRLMLFYFDPFVSPPFFFSCCIDFFLFSF